MFIRCCDSNQLNFLLFIGSGLQIREALQLQLDVQRRLHEQLEVYPCYISFTSMFSKPFRFILATSCLCFIYNGKKWTPWQFSEFKFCLNLLDCFQIQRKLQLRIEEQGKQLKMMFDQQQKTSDSNLSTQNLSNTTNNDRPISSTDVQVSISEGSEKFLIPSNIS